MKTPVLVLDLEDIETILDGDLSILQGFKQLHKPEKETCYKDSEGVWRCSFCYRALVWGDCPERCQRNEH